MESPSAPRPPAPPRRAPAAARPTPLLRASVALVLVIVGGLGRAVGAQAASPGGPVADVWVASSRRLPGTCHVPRRVGLDVERLSGGDCGRWQRAQVDELLAEQDRPLVVFVHGNRYAAHEAKSQGLRLARTLAAACPDAGPAQMLIFSWPSEQQGKLLRDVRAKYDRAPSDGHYLAWLLGRIDPRRPVAIVGYSYGALVGLQAMADLVTADPAGASGVAPWAGRPGRTHLVLVAPAVRCDALAPRGRYRDSLACVDRLTLVANSSDIVLRFFDCIDRCDRTEALGVVAMPRRWLPADLDYRAIDAADIVGPEHRLPPYLDSAVLARRIAAGAVADLDAPAAR